MHVRRTCRSYLPAPVDPSYPRPPGALCEMSLVTDPNGSEDVNDFLQRIRELGDKRDQEDDERTRKLEEEILQGRKERQARRAG